MSACGGENSSPVSSKINIDIAQFSTFAEYNSDVFNALLGKKNIALYFFADDCESCVDLKNKIETNISDFPGSAAFLVADFEKETELRSKYEVIAPSTVIYFHNNGMQMGKVQNPPYEAVKGFLGQ